jgi:large subunit ribosomal protein L17
MRHGKVGRKLKRTHSHRKATLSALSVSLIQHKKIKTTEAKAKETRRVVEKLITRAKRAVQNEGEGKSTNVHARREVFRFLRDREAVQTLFNDIAPKVANRPGGYTRVVKLGQRHGDGAHLALIELVDFNAATLEKASAKQAAKARKKAAEKEKRVTQEKKQQSEVAKEDKAAASAEG